jgi:hypothetical protein
MFPFVPSVFLKLQQQKEILAERVGFESTRERNFNELRGMMSIPKH